MIQNVEHIRNMKIFWLKILNMSLLTYNNNVFKLTKNKKLLFKFKCENSGTKKLAATL